jgi:hypothetical protein
MSTDETFSKLVQKLVKNKINISCLLNSGNPVRSLLDQQELAGLLENMFSGINKIIRNKFLEMLAFRPKTAHQHYLERK